MKINTGFMRWLTKNGDLKQLYAFYANTSSVQENLSRRNSLNAFFNEFLWENPKYMDYFRKYDELLTRENMMNLRMNTPDVDMVINQGELTKMWNHTLVFNGTKFTVICKQYQFIVNGTLQEVIKASYYNEEGLLVMDPDVYKSIIGLWIWIGYWPWWGFPLFYGEDVYLVIRYRNSWIIPGTDIPVLEAMNFHDKIKGISSIGTGTVTGIIATILWTVGATAAAAPLGVIAGAAAGIALWELDRAYESAPINDWGIRTVTYVHYIYPWTILGFLTSWVSQYFVWYDYSVHEWLPNSRITGIVSTGIGVNALILSSVQAAIFAESIKNTWYPWYTWVWINPYYG